MPEFRFYHLMGHRLDQALPALLEKAIARDMRAVVTASSVERLRLLDDALWVYQADSFLAHGQDGDDFPSLHPIWLSCAGNNPNNANLLMITDGVVPPDMASFMLCCDLFDGRDDHAVAAARERWRQCRDAGHNLSYWQQDDSGRWLLKAEYKPEDSL